MACWKRERNFALSSGERGRWFIEFLRGVILKCSENIRSDSYFDCYFLKSTSLFLYLVDNRSRVKCYNYVIRTCMPYLTVLAGRWLFPLDLDQAGQAQYLQATSYATNNPTAFFHIIAQRWIRASSWLSQMILRWLSHDLILAASHSPPTQNSNSTTRTPYRARNFCKWPWYGYWWKNHLSKSHLGHIESKSSSTGDTSHVLDASKWNEVELLLDAFLQGRWWLWSQSLMTPHWSIKPLLQVALPDIGSSPTLCKNTRIGYSPFTLHCSSAYMLRLEFILNNGTQPEESFPTVVIMYFAHIFSTYEMKFQMWHQWNRTHFIYTPDL